MTARHLDFDILDQRDPLKGPMLYALSVHLAIVAIALLSAYRGPRDTFGAPNAGGGAVGIEAVKTLPLIHRSQPNPVANDTDSDLPLPPPKAKEKEKRVKDDPNAIKLKDRNKKREVASVSPKQRFKAFDPLEENQVTSNRGPQVSNPIYSAMPGAGRIGTGADSPLGNMFPAYAEQIRRLVAQKWRSGEVDASIRTAPPVIVTFDLSRNGSVSNLVVLQKSSIPTLDSSVQRAILEAQPFPPIPPGFPRDTAKIEFWFELKR